MASKCRKCGNKDDYNFALNIGLCNPCIGEELEQLHAEKRRLNELVFAYESVNAPVNPLLEDNQRLKKQRDFSMQLSDMYVKELGLLVKRIKQNLKGFDQSLIDETSKKAFDITKDVRGSNEDADEELQQALKAKKIPKPTIKELEKLLDEPNKQVDIRPNGDVYVKDYEEPPSIPQLVGINNRLAKNIRQARETQSNAEIGLAQAEGINEKLRDENKELREANKHYVEVCNENQRLKAEIEDYEDFKGLP